MKVTITDVAWSHAGTARDSSNTNDIGVNVSGGAAGIDDSNVSLDSSLHDSRHGRSGVGSSTINDNNNNNNNNNMNNNMSSNNTTNTQSNAIPLSNIENDEDTNSLGNVSCLSDDSIVAAAGSNGVVVAWHARTALLDDVGSGGAGTGMKAYWSHRNEEVDAAVALVGQPEAVLAEHTRAVNRLAWHARQHDLLLSASQVKTFIVVSLLLLVYISH